MIDQDISAHTAADRFRRALVVVDLVESVRLMQADEAGVIRRWRALVAAVRQEVLPRHGGRMVKSLGDGMLLDFGAARAAAACALDLHRTVSDFNAGHPPMAHFRLRAGAHVADVVVDEFDLYGCGVNLAARLAGVADPGTTAASEEFVAALPRPIQHSMQDLGPHHLKHIDRPVRVLQFGNPCSALVPSSPGAWRLLLRDPASEGPASAQTPLTNLAAAA